MRKTMLPTCLALLAMVALSAADLAKTDKDVPRFPGLKSDVEKDSYVPDPDPVALSAASYQEALTAARAQASPDPVSFEETVAIKNSNYFSEATPEEVFTWYQQKLEAKAGDFDATRLSPGKTTAALITDLNAYDEGKVFTNFPNAVDGPATFNDGALYKKILQGRKKTADGWIRGATIQWAAMQTDWSLTTITVSIQDRGFAQTGPKTASYKQRTEVMIGGTKTVLHTEQEMLASKCTAPGWLALGRVAAKLSGFDEGALRRMLRNLSDADALALAAVFAEPLSEKNILVPPSPGLKADFDTQTHMWKPGSPMNLVVLKSPQEQAAIVAFYEAKLGKKAVSDGKGSFIFVLKGTSAQTAEQGLMIMPRQPGMTDTTVIVMKARP